MITAFTIGCTQEPEIIPVAAPEPVSTPAPTPEPVPTPAPTPEPEIEDILEDGRTNRTIEEVHEWMLKEFITDMPIKDIEEFFGSKSVEKYGLDGVWLLDDDSMVRVQGRGHLSYVRIFPADLSFFYNSDILFDIDKILALNDSEFADNEWLENSGNLVVINAESTAKKTNMFPENFVNLTDGVNGVQIELYPAWENYGTFIWYDGKHAMEVRFAQDDLSVSQMFFWQEND